MKKKPLEAGTSLHGFTVEKTIPLRELDSLGVSLVHDKTGLRLFHIANGDNENAFAFAFRTPPASSDGVAHILEHSVLCGSERFPLKDPFVVLLKGSMHTYLNAWTYPDKTVYPAASVNRTDYFNIMRVYGDAVFFPLLRPETFAQEGHHLEPADPADPAAGLAASGVVFSEMKGNYSSQRSIVAEWTFRSLFPDTPYGFDSGGEPAAILSLTYKRLKEFHRRYYHPSNCRVLLYGNIPTEEQLEFLESNFLSRFERSAVDSGIPLQPRFDHPRRLEKGYPVRSGEDAAGKTEVTVAWLLPEVTDSLARTAFLLLSEVLAGHAGSPLRRELVESGLGQDYSSAAGFEPEFRQMGFAAGLRGTDPDKAGKILETATGALSRLAGKGIPHDLVEAAFHQVEFGAREISGGGVPYPLRLFSRALVAWLHDAPPEETLLVLPALEELKRTMNAQPRFLESMIDAHLLKNIHRSLVMTAPDPDYMRKLEERIAAQIQKDEAALDGPKRSALLEDLARLKKFQETPDGEEAVKSIPFLKLIDLPRTAQTIETVAESLPGGIQFTFEPMFTNGIAYVDIALRVDTLPARLLPYAPLFGRLVTGAGLPEKSYSDVQRELSLLAGGFHSRTEAGLSLRSAESPGHLVFRLKALEGKLPDALALAGDLLRRADLGDTARLRDILLEARNSLASGIVSRGSYHALLRAGRVFSPALRLQETWEGVSQHVFLSGLCGGDCARLEEACAALSETREWILKHAPVALNAAADRSLLAKLKPALTEFGRGLGTEPAAPAKQAKRPSPQPGGEALLAAVGVGFTARVFPSAPFGSREYAAEFVLGHLLDTGPLHEKVRVQGGAYGAMSFPFRQEGLFAFGSYRDPRLSETFAAFSDCLHAAARNPVNGDELVKAITSVVGRDEQPLRPGEKGYVAFHRRLYGIDDAVRQEIRDRILALTPAGLAARAGRLAELLPAAATTVLTGKDAWEKAKRGHPDWNFTETEISL
ncbi:MAG: insulinase family protein [Spirochaetales bacterium]|nr:insulinase family protein [Spirochaetales bacterium]